MSEYKTIVVNENDASKRLDVFLTEKLGGVSRNHVRKMIELHLVSVNGKTPKPSYRLEENDVITYKELEVKEDSAPKKEAIPLDIIYEDKDIIVVNKPVGMVVHPHPGHDEGTLVNALLAHCDDLSTINGVKRPGIVHRLDKLTSGLIVACKNDTAHKELAKAFASREVEKRYVALVVGEIKEDMGEIIAPIGRSKTHRLKMVIDKEEGKEAITKFKVLERYKGFTLVEISLVTGRTHQIRVHFANINHPLVGDELYGKGRQHIYKGGQLLHAKELSFVHPTTKQLVTFTSDLPKHFIDILDILELRE